MNNFLYCLLFIKLVWSLTQTNAQEHKGVGFMLPGNLIPHHYDINWIFLDNCCGIHDRFTFNRTFHGNVKIKVTATKPNVKMIELNAYKLKITKATLSTCRGSKPIDMGIPKYYERERKVVFKSPTKLPTSKPLTLDITFQGKISLGPKGLIVSSDPDGNKWWDSLGSSFEAAFARTAFPCFDEPKYKATFRVSLNVSTCIMKKGYQAHSNAVQEKKIEKNGRTIIYFKKTSVVMSTYLISIFVSPFVSSPVSKFNSSFPDVSKTEWKELRTWGTHEEVNSWQVRVVQKAGVRLMEAFSAMLGVGYPLKKLDVVSAYGPAIRGMENWGMIDIGLPPRNSSLFELLSHEMSHQWFGDLATCHWWSDVWLNEGFATFFAMLGTDKIKLKDPNTEDLNVRTFFIIDKVIPALKVDIGKRSRPISYPIEDPAEYQYIFDIITYEKGGSILRMWSYVLGEDVFLLALQKYLKAAEFGSTTPELLFKEFDSVANKSASDFKGGRPSVFFRNWITKPGYPVVEVKRLPNDTLTFSFSQRVFRGHQNKTKWTVPISYSADYQPTFDQTAAMFWLEECDEYAFIKFPIAPKWIVVNNQFAGYFRVNYDRVNWERLVAQLIIPANYTAIPEANRIQILNDLLVFVIHRDNPNVDDALLMDASLYLKHEMSYHPWKAALDHMIDYLDTMIAKYPEFYPIFKKYARDLLDPHYKRLTDAESSHSNRELRKEIASWACKMDLSDCLKDADDFFQANTRRDDAYHPMFETALCAKIRKNDSEWDALWERFTSQRGFLQRKALITGMSCSRDKDVIKRLLMRSITKDVNIHPKERKAIFTAVLRGDPENTEIAFDFMVGNYESIEEMYSGYSPLSELLLSISDKLGTDEEVKKMENFLDALTKEKKVKLKTGLVPQVLETCRINNGWINRNAGKVFAWLISHYG